MHIKQSTKIARFLDEISDELANPAKCIVRTASYRTVFIFDIPVKTNLLNAATFLVQMTTIYSAAQRLSPSAAFPQNAQAGPSKGSQSSLKKRLPLPSASQAPLALAPKRKRNDTPDETSADSASSQLPRRGTTRREGPKKKKASRACYHCQKAHLTCDDCNPIVLILCILC